MSVIWFIIGAVVGYLVAWYFLKNKCNEQLETRDREISRLKSELASATAAPRTIAQPSPQAKTEKPQPLMASPAKKQEPDELTRINGIGPVLKKKLNNLGIDTFQQIADFTQADIDRVNGQLSFKGRIEREKWVEQAKKLARE